ncbi:unnamed protein product [Symbiodinium sp. CCMP2592]|nr:unnamed protein product [Symbiodinium sp. CCMP2592]
MPGHCNLLILGMFALFSLPTAKPCEGCEGEHVLVQRGAAVRVTSSVALRLRERLAMKPDAIEQAAVSAGVELRPVHHKLLDSLRRAGPALVQANRTGESGGEYIRRMAGELDDFQNVGGLMAEASALTGSLLGDLMEGRPVDIRSTLVSAGGLVGTFIGTVVGMAFPMLGLFVTMGISVLTGIFGSSGGDQLSDALNEALQELYEKIMGEVKEYVTEFVTDYVNSKQALEFRTELNTLKNELGYMPEIFQDSEGVAAGFEPQMRLLWMLMVQRDLDSLLAQFLGGLDCLPATWPPSAACLTWHKQCTLVETFELVLLQANFILQMGELEPSWGRVFAKEHQRKMEDTTQILSMARWMCMAGRQEKTHFWLVDDAEKVTKYAEPKLRMLMSLSSSTSPTYRNFLSYKKGTEALYKNMTCLDNSLGESGIYGISCGNASQFLQGIHLGLPGQVPLSRIEHMGVYFFDGFPLIAQGAQMQPQSSLRDPAEIECQEAFISKLKKMDSNLFHIQGMTNMPSCILPPCSLQHDPKLSALPRRCLEIDASTAEAMSPWIGCPAGMFVSRLTLTPIHQSTPTFSMKCCTVRPSACEA